MPGEITIYTDGASSGNPGPGGYGVVLISGKHRLEKSEGFMLTTNNRMELMAVIIGLEALKIPGSKVVIYTDSKYVADSVEKGWIFQWESKSFKKKKNPDLWIRFLNVYRKHNVRFVWIKGHSNNIENERCDRLAVSAYTGASLIQDTGYSNE
jgi:ribonuclease HI